MAIRSFVTGLGATHLFMLEDTSRDSGSTGIATSFTTGTGGSFVASPTVYGVDNCFRSNTVNDFTTRQQGGAIGNTADTNTGSGLYDTRSLLMAFSCSDYSTPSCAYEQGGGVNNFAFVTGLGRSITFQAADAGQEFIIVQSKFQGAVDRVYQCCGIWMRHTEHAGAGNLGRLIINGVFQDEYISTATAAFPSHTGDIVVGNTDESLKAYNEDTIPYAVRSNDINMLGMFNDVVLTEAQCREIFERTVLPEDLIAADTVANQQIALDALSGNTYQGVNCAIEIRQATDATDYTLSLDNITFSEDPNLRDIAVKYVGPNTLTLINDNGSNAVEVSTPSEQDLDGSTVLTGGGTITIVNPALVTLNGLIAGSEVRIYQAGTNTEVAGIENTAGTTFSATLQDASVDISVLSLGYQNIRLLGIDLTGGDLTIPIQQQLDRQYANG